MLRPLIYLCVLLSLTGVKGQSIAAAEICSVIGPSVIDFQESVGLVSDLCAYSLVSDQSNGFEVVASFRERDDPDVTHLDSVILRLDNPSVEIRLELGGVVLVNNTEVNLDSSVQRFYGVDLSDDDTGVTAEFTTSTQSFSVFFDGDTAQISLDAAADNSLSGLCVNSSSISSVRRSDYSSSSCRTEDTQAVSARRKRSNPDDTVIEHCNLMESGPLGGRNGAYNPKPYINACNKVCGYTEFNHFWCQFTWAYARACSRKHPGDFGDWRKQTTCTCIRPVCKKNRCNDHEYCGLRFDGEPGCLCRGHFAYEYRYSKNYLGEHTECKKNSAKITLIGCLLEEKCIDYTDLHLNDKSCKGTRDERTHLVTFDFNTKDTCGADISMVGQQIKYTNVIMDRNITDLITRQDHVSITFSCYYPQPERQTVHFRIKDNSYVSVITSGVWNYTVYMKAYIDEKCTKVIATETDVKLNQKVWVELTTHGLHADTISVVTDSCWATSDSDPNSSTRLDLIKNGCPAEKTVGVTGNGIGTHNYFSFNMFEFTKQPNYVYLHCQLQLCLKKNNCVPNCTQNRIRRFARSKFTGEAPALISMAWGK